jgi:hypothetical protein
MDHEEFWGDGCIAPPGPSGAALMAAVDGEADEEMRRHLSECTHCARTVERLSSLQRNLRRRLYRSLCPTTDQLIDYCQGLISLPQRARLIHHLMLCPYCSEEINLLEQNLLGLHHTNGPEAFFS